MHLINIFFWCYNPVWCCTAKVQNTSLSWCKSRPLSEKTSEANSDSSRWPPGSISPLNQLINRLSCGRSVPVNWGGTNWTILRTLSALWLITRGKSDIHLIETHRDWCGTAFRHLVRLQRNPAKGFVLKVHVYFHISGYLFVCLWLKRLEGAKSDCTDL